MKKFISVMIIMMLLCSNMVFAEDNQTLAEKMSSIWLSPEAEPAVLETIKEENGRKIDELIDLYLIAPGYAREKIGFSADDEIMKEQVKQEYEVNEDKILKVFYVDNSYYAQQYAENNVFNYLISDEYYLIMPNNRYVDEPSEEDKDHILLCHKYFSDGKMPNEKEYVSKNLSMYFINEYSFNLLQNEQRMSEILSGIDLDEIKEIKFVVLDSSCSFLYIQCNSAEYVVRMYMGKYRKPDEKNHVLYDWVKDLELYKLYNVKDFFNTISTEMNMMNDTKPTYEAEAQVLQQQGILFGNDNGLDLLKPMTRIEAAAMVLRVLEVPQKSPDESVQVFSDVPQTHWGYASASQAYDLGLIAGVGDGEFAPDRTVTGTEFASILLRAAGTYDFDWEEALNILVEQNIITREQADKMDLFTRGDMAKIIYEAQEAGMF